MSAAKQKRETLRILRFLQFGQPVEEALMQGMDRMTVLSSGEGRKLAIRSQQLNALVSAGAVSRSTGVVQITREGQYLAARMTTPEDNQTDQFATQHRDLAQATVQMNGENHTVTLNMAESPLARLRKRKNEAGNPFLSDAAFAAGEKLRLDFTKGEMTPRVSASWDMTLVSKKGKGGRPGTPDLSDHAIDARSRMQQALDAMGPDLSGVVSDVCCYLKGLESVEKERRWPPRSAKIMLRAGLEILARHYGMIARPNGRSKIRATA